MMEEFIVLQSTTTKSVFATLGDFMITNKINLANRFIVLPLQFYSRLGVDPDCQVAGIPFSWAI